MVDIPNTRFINLVDIPATIAYSQFGEAQVPLDPQTGGVLQLEEYRQVSFRIGSTKAASFTMFMGKISGTTLSMRYIGPIDDVIHTFDVVAPEMTLFLMGGAPRSRETVQLWLYLRS
jgi:hypothetical protein